MAGSLRQLPSGSWQLRVYMGRHETGRVVHRTKTMQGSRREAQSELNQMVAQFQGGLADVTDGQSTPGERVIRWGPATTIKDAIEG